MPRGVITGLGKIASLITYLLSGSSAPGGDSTPPTFQSASVNTTATYFYLNVTETETVPCEPSSGAAGVTLTGSITGAISLGPGTRTGNRQWRFPITGDVDPEETITCDYSQGSGNITDGAGNELTAFSNAVVTNNATGGGGSSSNVQYIIPVGEQIPADTVFLTAGDEAGKFLYQLRDTVTGQRILIAEDAVVLFRLKELGAGSAAIDAAGEVEYGADGKVSFTFTEDEPVPAAGRYQAVFVVDGVTFPTVTHGGPIPVLISEALA
jgi:hypothetical protein